MMENQLILEYIANIVRDWRTVMAHQVLTPRLRQHLQSAILIYCETANQQTLDLSKFVDNLERVRVEVEDHWSQILGQLSVTARVYEQMTVFEEFLRGKLLKDYRRIPYVVDAKIVWLGRSMGSLAYALPTKLVPNWISSTIFIGGVSPSFLKNLCLTKVMLRGRCVQPWPEGGNQAVMFNHSSIVVNGPTWLQRW